MNTKIQSYKDLNVWRQGIEIVDHIYEITERFPGGERFVLASQMQRAAISIPSNIAEGFARQHTKEYTQFCHIALASCAELETQLIIAKRRFYVSEEVFIRCQTLLDVQSRMLMSLIKSLRAK